jgi:hypothetical protein
MRKVKIAALLLLYLIVLWAIAEAQTVKIPDEYSIMITGRILNEKKEPLVHLNIIISETQADNVAISWRIGGDGKLANPQTYTDANGRFSIAADRRFWEKTGYFTLYGGFLPGTTQNAGVLRGPGGGPVVIKTDPKTKKFEIGDIIVSKQ